MWKTLATPLSVCRLVIRSPRHRWQDHVRFRRIHWDTDEGPRVGLRLDARLQYINFVPKIS
jgi:hypothetical protein